MALLYVTPSNAGNRDTSLGLAPYTSPSIAASGEVAFQGTDNHLWLYDPGTGHSRDTGLGMNQGTSPAIVSLAGGGYEIALQANTGILCLMTPAAASASIPAWAWTKTPARPSRPPQAAATR